ncbi:hypothetical protein ASPZODRAFT_60277 [Penicilliopsis zonata CBS 506.65]|uniref:Zn(2)-C6 fungal-type domain-containing protein n=1 Tax=Penicilliopsis zonata CBS 506.65 TaxID=1073090 RepID=A0A1L9SPE8_9EURO|nr:hypothetical protein ASPZODRAFT_60277 [Penicilliopsis zonata CBS 506.65]OJJ48973.1 hypothetical protein ASPZODRAFT_60277 [Penicilliopsis zonata CBS 506.65]
MTTPPHTSSSAEPRRRVRRWHQRGFTGCSTCRRRHVRCDEASPRCQNCFRLGLECDGSQGRMTFKVYNPASNQQNQASTTTPESSESEPTQQRRTVSPETDKTDSTSIASPLSSLEMFLALTSPQPQNGRQLPPPPPPPPPPRRITGDLPSSPTLELDAGTTPLLNVEEEGYILAHFVNHVSILLIAHHGPVYAINKSNKNNTKNPFQCDFPLLAQSSPAMLGAMQALGALHLANTAASGTQDTRHFQYAMAKYSDVVKLFRLKSHQTGQRTLLADLATCLLLCYFEMMDSQHPNWLVHLKGAKEIYRIMFHPTPAEQADRVGEGERQAAVRHPLLTDLLLLLADLDVAGACATVNGTVIPGPYWRMHAVDGGGSAAAGWEQEHLHNTTNTSPTPVSFTGRDQVLAELTDAWAGLMEIRASTSKFGKAKDEDMPVEQQDVVFGDLLNSLLAWRASAPECLRVLGLLDLNTTTRPTTNSCLPSYPYPDLLAYAACLEAYEKATALHLYKIVAAGRPDQQINLAHLNLLACRILDLVAFLADGVGQLAILWPLFIAGREACDYTQQLAIRDRMIGMQRFGFKNVERTLESLEDFWSRKRAFPGIWIESINDLRSSVLL